MLKKFNICIIEECLLHNCICTDYYSNFWDNIYQVNKKDKLHIYCKGCNIKLPIFYTLGFKIKKGFDNGYEFMLIGKNVKRLYKNLTTNIIEYEIEI